MARHPVWSGDLKALALAAAICSAGGVLGSEFMGYPVRDPLQVSSLNGEWDFRLDGTNEWRKVRVPGNWELQGILDPVYMHAVGEHRGLCRRSFRYDPAWKGRHVILRLDGVLFGCRVMLNGQCLGSATSAFNLHMFDMTPALNEGENVLEVEVSTRAKGWLWDTNDCWCLTGIMRDVEAFAVPDVHFADMVFGSEVEGDGSAVVKVRTEIASFDGPVPEGLQVEVSLSDHLRRHVADFRAPVGRSGILEFSRHVDNPRLWTAETPALYNLSAALKGADGRVLQRIGEKVGIRSVRTDGFSLLVNNSPVTLRGTCWNEIDPLHGRSMTYRDFRGQMELMKKANVNFIRTAHYPFSPVFLSLCDEMGFYVCDEIPMGAAGRHGLDDPELEGEISNRVWRTVVRDRNRASVLVWTVSNESPFLPPVSRALRYVRELDPTRPKCVPQLGKDFAEKYVLDPDPEMDVLSGHYLGHGELYAKAMSRATRPVLQTEFGHSCGNACTELEPCWRLIESEPKAIGAAVWCWRDQALLRPSGPANLSVKLGDGRFLDAYGIFGSDGVVYADGYPKESYFLLRRLYAPVTVEMQTRGLRCGETNLVSSVVRNRQDFLPSDGWRFSWSLRDAGRLLSCGEFAASAPPRGDATLEIPVAVPPVAEVTYPTLSVEAFAPDGAPKWEESHRVALLGARPSLAASGMLAPRMPRGEDFILRVGRKMSMIQMAQQESLGENYCWQPHLLSPDVEGVSTEGGRTEWRLKWHRDGVRGTNEFVMGMVAASRCPDGRIGIEYELKPSDGSRGIMLECGLALDLGGDVTHVDWLGRGPYSQVPGKTAHNADGRWRLHKDDCRFDGNRSGVERLLAFGPGFGLAFWPGGGDFGMENHGGHVIVSSNAQVLPYCGKSSSVVPVQVPPLAECVFRGRFTYAEVPGEKTAPVAERPYDEDYGW